MDPAITTLLQQGIAALKAGRPDEARRLLLRVIDADERNEQAWLWLSGATDDPHEIRICLQNVLAINPNSAPAKKGMAVVEQRFGPAPAAPLERAVGASAPPARAVTTTTLSLDRGQFERSAAAHAAAAPAPAPRMPTTRLSEPAPEAPAAATPARRPPPPTMLMARVATPPAPPAAPMLVAIPDSPGRPAATAAQPAEIPVSAVPEHPCPYCGAPTTLKQERCTQCRESLRLRAAPPAQRSLALSLLGIVWGIGGACMIIAALLLGVLLLLARQAPAPANAPVASEFLAIVLAALLLFGLLCFGLARGLWARLAPFYFLNIALIVVGVIVRVGLLLRGSSLIRTLAALASQSGRWAGPIAAAAAVLPLVLGVLLVLLPIVLTILSYRDFFGPLRRFQPAVEQLDHAEHYNRGIAYRNRGMVYMAIQEWAAASRAKPGDRTYLQALGLAYAQITQRYPNSKAYLGTVEASLRARKAELYAAAPELAQLNML